MDNDFIADDPTTSSSSNAEDTVRTTESPSEKQPEQPKKTKKRQFRRARRVPVYFYPGRSKEYKTFVERFPYTTQQAALRKIFVEGWDQAKEEFDTWLAGDRDPENAPIVEFQSTERSEGQYNVYLSPMEPLHEQMLNYIDKLERRLYRQRFLQLVFVRGSQKPGIEDMIRGL